MNENYRIHYQTSFCIKNDNGKYSPINSLQKIIYDWLTYKEKDHRFKDFRNDFYKKCDWSNLYKSYGSIATNTYYADEGRCWALRYNHYDAQFWKQRHWYIDIGIREISEKEEAIFYCKIYYAKDAFDLSERELPTPPSNTPRFIRNILNRNNSFKVYSQESCLGLYDVPVPFKLTYGKDLADLIEHKNRRYALLVFNGDDERLIKEAKTMARDLAGKAQVITLDQDPEFAEELRHYFKKDLLVRHNSFRVFFPLNPDRAKPLRHRWFYLDEDYYEYERDPLINSLLKNYNLTELEAVTNISEVGRMISKKKLFDAFKKGDHTEKDLDQLIEEYTKLEDEKLIVEKERDEWLGEYEEVESQLTQLKLKQEAMNHHSARKEKDILVCYNKHLKSLPQSLNEIVQIKSDIFEDRVIFTEEAFSSASQYSDCKSLDKAWEILHHIGTTLYEIKFLSDQKYDIAKVFQERSSFEYAKTEGPNTKNNSRISQTRMIKHNSRDYEIWTHIIYGNEMPRMLRIHFDYDEELKKIVVGYVGPHMENATSKKRK